MLRSSLLLISLVPCLATAQDAADIEREVLEARSERDAEIEVQRDKLLDELNRKREFAKRRGDLDLLERIDKQHNSLLVSGEFPDLVATSATKSAILRANRRVISALKAAESAFVKADLIDDAKLMRDERLAIESSIDMPSLTLNHNPWVPLFNGRDLDGWSTAGDNSVSWQVKDGVLVGASADLAGTLYTNRNDFANFHFRVETMIADGANSSQNFRFNPATKTGYRAFIGGTERAVINGSEVDSLTKTADLYSGSRLLADAPTIPLQPQQWFTQEVIAKGQQVTVLVNGKVFVVFKDPSKAIQKGALGVMCRGGSVVRFRRIEVRELPPSG